MSIIRWKRFPFNELEELLHESRTGDLATDMYEDNGSIIVKIHVPGINPDKVDISVEGDQLRVSGERKEEEETEDRQYYRKEIQYGDFDEIIPLPVPVIAEKVTAETKNGVLIIALPKQTQGKSHKVKITEK